MRPSLGELSAPALCAVAGMSLSSVTFEQEEQLPCPTDPSVSKDTCLQNITGNLLTTEKGDFQTYSHRTTLQIIELDFGLKAEQLNKYQSSRSFIYSFSRYLLRA